MEKLKKIITIFCLIIMALILGMATFENGILLSIISFAFIIFFVKKVKIKRFSIFLIVFCLITKILGAIVFDVPMSFDYKNMYDASESLISGNFSFLSNQYFSTYGYQLFHVFYQGLALLICNKILFLKILNCLYSTIITVLIYKIIKRFASEETARISSLIYAISLYPIYLNSVLGNQQLGLMLFLLGIYILITKKSTIMNGIIIGLLFAFGNLERPEGIIYIMTLIVYNIITIKGVKEILKDSIPVVITYFLITQIASIIMIKTGVNEIGFKNNDPYWKFVLGFNHEYSGKFNTPDFDDYAMKPELEKEVIKERISDVKNLPSLMYQKVKIQWLYGDLDKAFHATSNSQFSQSLIQLMITYIKTMNLIIILITFIGLIKNKNIDKTNYFFIINILVYFMVYLLIEVSGRYYYNPQVDVIILFAIGFERICNKYKEKNVKRR